MLKIEITTGPRNKFHAIPRFPTGPFAVYVGDHLRFGIISGLGIICGAVQCSPPPLRGADRGALYHVQCSVTVPHNPFRMGFSVYYTLTNCHDISDGFLCATRPILNA